MISSCQKKRLTIFVPKADWTLTLKQSILWCKMYVPPSDAFENCRFGGWEHGFHVSAGLQGSPQVPGVDGNDRIHFIPPPSRHLGNNNALLSAWRNTLKHLGEILWNHVRKHYEKILWKTTLSVPTGGHLGNDNALLLGGTWKESLREKKLEDANWFEIMWQCQ